MCSCKYTCLCDYINRGKLGKDSSQSLLAVADEKKKREGETEHSLPCHKMFLTMETAPMIWSHFC